MVRKCATNRGHSALRRKERKRVNERNVTKTNVSLRAMNKAAQARR